ncbi:ankyrin repeat-containing domain protein [Dactylonectria estremocensis]|uniref:Ankyrin repeat-containing domain protein n=1 Tax=Dactylonectria estremocensis TaxID=1079267 RepID=A0A9P9F9M9_9HYPO|nr:ankyrin repeat-containing domain protein [Dactylonectria estremocensis]
MNVHFYSETLRTHIKVRDEVMLALSQLKRAEEGMCDGQAQITCLGLRHAKHAGYLGNSPKRQTIATKRSQLAAWLLFLGFRGTILCKRTISSTTIRVSMKFRLPQSWGLRKTVIAGDFTFSLKSGYRIPRCHVRAFSLVAEDAGIMVACEQGNMFEVQRLLQRHEASVFDVTPSNYSPIYYAILGGNVEVVQLLLDQHTDLANCPFGANDTSPLQLALLYRRLRICRILLSHNASPCYVNSLGRTPIFYLAMPKHDDDGSEKCCFTEDFFSLFSDNSLFLDLEVQDLSGFTILEQVAAHGTAGAVSALIRLGADLPSQWLDGDTPLSCAISCGNLSTFKTLLPYYPHLEQPGPRGYTMLGYAAYFGSDCIVRHLLRLGAIDLLFECNHAPELGGPGLPPQLYEQYMQVLEECGRIVMREDTSDDGSEMDIYWDANEENEWIEA